MQSATYAVYIGVPGCLAWFVVDLVFVLFGSSFRGSVGACSAGHLIYTESILDFLLQDAKDLDSDACSSIRSESTGRGLKSLLGRSRAVAGVVSG